MFRIPKAPKRKIKCCGFRDKKTGEIITKCFPIIPNKCVSFFRRCFGLCPPRESPRFDPDLKFIGCLILLSDEKCKPELFEDKDLFPEP